MTTFAAPDPHNGLESNLPRQVPREDGLEPLCFCNVRGRVEVREVMQATTGEL